MRAPSERARRRDCAAPGPAGVGLRHVGEDGLLVEVPADAVQSLCAWLMQGEWAPWIEDIVPSHRTVLVMASDRRGDIAAAIRTGAWREQAIVQRSIKTVEIPIVYGGPDLEEVCERTQMTAEALMEAHSSVAHTVAHFGFSPGFPYLSGLPDELHIPRRSTPRQSIPEGSVAIAAGLTVIYPGGTPGGWNLIGRAAAPMFWDITRDPPNLLSLGDRIVFRVAP